MLLNHAEEKSGSNHPPNACVQIKTLLSLPLEPLKKLEKLIFVTILIILYFSDDVEVIFDANIFSSFSRYAAASLLKKTTQGNR